MGVVVAVAEVVEAGFAVVVLGGVAPGVVGGFGAGGRISCGKVGGLAFFSDDKRNGAGVDRRARRG